MCVSSLSCEEEVALFPISFSASPWLILFFFDLSTMLFRKEKEMWFPSCFCGFRLFGARLSARPLSCVCSPSLPLCFPPFSLVCRVSSAMVRMQRSLLFSFCRDEDRSRTVFFLRTDSLRSERQQIRETQNWRDDGGRKQKPTKTRRAGSDVQQEETKRRTEREKTKWRGNSF